MVNVGKYTKHMDDMGVSKNRATAKWMVKIMENPIKMDDLGGTPPIFGNTHMGKIIRKDTPHLQLGTLIAVLRCGST